jgi:hypothetical protein
VLAHAGRRSGVPDRSQLVATARKQGMNPLAVLRQLFEGQAGYQPLQSPEQLPRS